ncbi:hypothetical protein X943_003337 [Babesia divergens]|uniref:Uncharacterized protein n=1 Tax=Babesia divergens TaxID=32595 RepID=A0AAD9GJV9_BABDI|nr:hypothetical protein X943_003337 [Babesia divergens]
MTLQPSEPSSQVDTETEINNTPENDSCPTTPNDGGSIPKSTEIDVGVLQVQTLTQGIKISSDDKPLRRTKAAPPVDAIADEISCMPMFETHFFTRETIPKLSLPYGFIRHNDGADNDMNTTELSKADPNHWFKAIYDDCVSYIKASGTLTGEFEWYHDFIVFTNLQIAVYNKGDLMDDEVALDLVLNYTVKHARNLRSAVARNALLFITCMIEMTTTNIPLRVAVSLRLLPQLLICSTSEKVVYRKPAVDNIGAITANCHDIEFIDIGWMLMGQANNRNPKLCHAATQGIRDFLRGLDDTALDKINRGDLVLHINPCLGSRNASLRKATSGFMLRFIAKCSKEDLDKWWLELDKNSNIAKLLKPHVTVSTPNEETTGAPEPNDIA